MHALVFFSVFGILPSLHDDQKLRASRPYVATGYVNSSYTDSDEAEYSRGGRSYAPKVANLDGTSSWYSGFRSVFSPSKVV